MKKKIVIKRYSDLCVVKTIDVTNKTDYQIDKIEDGMNINLDHEKYFTIILVDGS